MIIGNPITLGGGGTTVGVSYNSDGTQNLIIKDKGNFVEVPPVLLWSNTNHTSTFSAQTLTLSEEYSNFLIEFKYANSTAKYMTEFIADGVSSPVAAIDTSNNVTVFRTITVSGNSIVFATGKLKPAASNSVSDNDGAIIPVNIWGVKYAV